MSLTRSRICAASGRPQTNTPMPYSGLPPTYGAWAAGGCPLPVIGVPGCWTVVDGVAPTMIGSMTGIGVRVGTAAVGVGLLAGGWPSGALSPVAVGEADGAGVGVAGVAWSVTKSASTQ